MQEGDFSTKLHIHKLIFCNKETCLSEMFLDEKKFGSDVKSWINDLIVYCLRAFSTINSVSWLKISFQNLPL